MRIKISIIDSGVKFEPLYVYGYIALRSSLLFVSCIHKFSLSLRAIVEGG